MSNDELLEALASGDIGPESKRRAEELLFSSGEYRALYRKLAGARFPQIPNYTIIEQIGKGGFGVVYKAVHHETERVEAIKVLFAKTPLLTAYFENEVHLIARLRHPNIATLYDAQLSTPPLYYTMDFVQGQRLNDTIKSPELTLAARVEIIKRIASAIGYAHAQGVIHRDIKPPNILIDAAGQPHIVDFGIAKRLRLADPNSPPADESGAEGPVGTLGYIAPEVVSGGRSDGRVDVFALGALLFHCVTLEPARLARDPALRSQLLKARRVSAPDDLSAIIARCVEKSPDNRYANCEELVADLDRYLTGRETAARRDRTLGERMRRAASLLLRNRPGLVYCGAIGFVALIWSVLLYRLMANKYMGEMPVSEQVALIGMNQQTMEAIDDGKLAPDLEDMRSTEVTSWRPLHGRLMKILARVRPKVVAWDIAFRDNGSAAENAALIEGLQALETARIPVVLGIASLNPDGLPHLSPDVQKAATRFGSLASVNDANLVREYFVVWAFQRGLDAPIPGLAAAAFAAARYPDSDAVFELDELRKQVRIKYRKRNPEISAIRWENAVDLLEVQEFHHISPDWASKNIERGVLQANDLVVHGRVRAVSPDLWQQRMIPYHDVFVADERRLHDWFANKAVVVANMSGSEDLRRSASGQPMYGCIVHAQALDTLLAGAGSVRYGFFELAWRICLWCAAAGLLIWLRPLPSAPAPLWIGAGCVLGIVAGLTILTWSAVRIQEDWLLQLCIAASAMLASAGVAFLLVTLRFRLTSRGPAAITFDADTESLPSTMLAGGKSEQ